MSQSHPQVVTPDRDPRIDDRDDDADLYDDRYEGERDHERGRRAYEDAKIEDLADAVQG